MPYISLTRPKKSLQILTALKSGGAKQAHSFLNQLPDKHIDLYSYKKSNRITSKLNGKQGFIDYLNKLNFTSQGRK